MWLWISNAFRERSRSKQGNVRKWINRSFNLVELGDGELSCPLITTEHNKKQKASTQGLSQWKPRGFFFFPVALPTSFSLYKKCSFFLGCENLYVAHHAYRPDSLKILNKPIFVIKISGSLFVSVNTYFYGAPWYLKSLCV